VSLTEFDTFYNKIQQAFKIKDYQQRATAFGEVIVEIILLKLDLGDIFSQRQTLGDNIDSKKNALRLAGLNSLLYIATTQKWEANYQNMHLGSSDEEYKKDMKIAETYYQSAMRLFTLLCGSELKDAAKVYLDKFERACADAQIVGKHIDRHYAPLPESSLATLVLVCPGSAVDSSAQELHQESKFDVPTMPQSTVDQLQKIMDEADKVVDRVAELKTPFTYKQAAKAREQSLIEQQVAAHTRTVQTQQAITNAGAHLLFKAIASTQAQSTEITQITRKRRR